MERDPLHLAWKTSPVRHLLGFVLLVMAGLLLLAGFDLVRTAVDQAVGGTAPGAADTSLLRVAVNLPKSVLAQPLVLFPGIPLSPEAFRIAAAAGVVLVPILIGVILMALDWIVVGIGTGVLARIRTRILDAILRAPPTAQEEVSILSSLASQALVRETGVLGAAMLVPVQLAGTIGLAIAYVLVTDWLLGVTLAIVLALGGILNARQLLLRLDIAKSRYRESEVTEAAFKDLRHRLPALRAHGTEPYERVRLSRILARGHDPVEKREYRRAPADSLALAALMIAPLSVLALGVWFAESRPVSAGSVAACILAGSLAAWSIRELVQWQRLVDRAKTLLADVAHSLIVLQSRDRDRQAAPLPESGPLEARGVSAYDPVSGVRIGSFDLSLAFPAHVAVVGDGESGPRLFSALIGGLIHPSTGQLTYGGVELAACDPAERAQRIALAGETVLIPGSLRDNLLYGFTAPAEEAEARLAEAIAIVGLDRLIHARGLAGTLDPRREPRTAEALVESRRIVHAALVEEGLDRFVDPFHAERYNRYATVGENLLFGKPIGDTFREDRLASHPFVRAILEANDLTKPLARMGLSIATSMIEIFAEIPAGHPLFERFAFFSASDRTYFEDLVERRNEKRRGIQTARDQERLIGLALRYDESRHRLGLLDEAMEARIVAARADFAHMLPVSLKPSIEFYDEDGFCAAASVQDNLLFGRIAADQAGAAEAVQSMIRRVLTERGLNGEVSRIGLDAPIDVQGGDLTSSEIAAIDLVRCLVRRPGILIVQRALEGLPGPAAEKLVANLRRTLIGRGLIVVTPEITPAMDQPPFDAVIRFERGEPVLDNRVRKPEPVPA